MKTHLFLLLDYRITELLFKFSQVRIKLYILRRKQRGIYFVQPVCACLQLCFCYKFSTYCLLKVTKNQHPPLYTCTPSTCKSVAIIPPPRASHPSREFWVFATSLMQAKSRVSAANFADPSEFPARKSSAIWRVVRESPPLTNVLF